VGSPCALPRRSSDLEGASGDLKWTVALILATGALSGATLARSFREGNSIFLQLSDGTAKIEWLNDSSFRFSRWWEGSWVEGPPIDRKSTRLNSSHGS